MATGPVACVNGARNIPAVCGVLLSRLSPRCLPHLSWLRMKLGMWPRPPVPATSVPSSLAPAAVPICVTWGFSSSSLSGGFNPTPKEKEQKGV